MGTVGESFAHQTILTQLVPTLLSGPTSKGIIVLGIHITIRDAHCMLTLAKDSTVDRVARRVQHCHCHPAKSAASSESSVVRTIVASKSWPPTPLHKSTPPPQNSAGVPMAVALTRLLGTMATAVAVTGMRAGHAVACQMLANFSIAQSA